MFALLIASWHSQQEHETEISQALWLVNNISLEIKNKIMNWNWR